MNASPAIRIHLAAAQAGPKTVLARRRQGFWLLAWVLLGLVASSHAGAASAFTFWVQVAAGRDHTCALQQDRSLWCWGSNAYGQLGTSDTTLRVPTPLRVGSDKDWIHIDAGDHHNCALKSNGNVYCWGDNRYGQLGTGSDEPWHIPAMQRVVFDQGFLSVSADGGTTCAITSSNHLLCWGENFYGQVGYGVWGSATNIGWPTYIGAGVLAVSTGTYHSCAITTGRQTFCWGSNSGDLLGVGDGPLYVTLPTPVLGAAGYTTLDNGERHTCALTTDGRMYCWGRNRAGQLGDGTWTDRRSPTAVRSQTGKWSIVTAGAGFTCGLMTGDIKCWGSNSYGELGLGDTTDRNAPQSISDRLWIRVNAGYRHACGIRSNGTLRCWGLNRSGQLGDGTFDPRRKPVDVSLHPTYPVE